MLHTDLPAGAIGRLTEHYGPSVRPWLDQVETTLALAAARWKIELSGYHDAGWTSVVAIGRSAAGQPVLIKVLPERQRYEQERAALLHWRQAPVNRLLRFDNANQLLLLAAVAGVPGGGPEPPDHSRRVARALSQLHRSPASTAGPIPLLIDYYLGSVVPRVQQRAQRFGHIVGPGNIERCVQLSRRLCARPARQRLLHSDLYAENVLFDETGQPVFIDPHAKIGSPAFDWAFWCVYYIPTSGFAERVALCRQYASAELDEALAWLVTLAIDGALYYLDTDDHHQTAAMLAVLASEPLKPLVRAPS
jgi:streptomycin 6-kinase